MARPANAYGINMARESAMLHGKTIRQELDDERRVKCYPEGGLAQERLIPGIGWCVADDEEWPEVEEAIASW